MSSYTMLNVEETSGLMFLLFFLLIIKLLRSEKKICLRQFSDKNDKVKKIPRI